MIDVRFYEPGDAAKLEIKDIFKGFEKQIAGVDNLTEGENSYAHTVTQNNKPIAIIGGTILLEGVMDVWTISSPETLKIPVLYTKIVRRCISHYHASLKIHRFQCAVLKDFNSGQRWVQALGFTPEGIMRKFGPSGSDYILYARVY